MTETPSHTLAARLVGELTRVLQAELPDLAVQPTTEDAAGAGWRMKAIVAGPFDGVATIWIDRAGGMSLASHLLGSQPEPADEVVVNRLRQVWAVVIGAADFSTPLFEGMNLRSPVVEAGDAPDATTTVDLLFGGARARVTAAAALRPAVVDADVPGNQGQSHFEALLDIDLPLVVRFARTTMSIKTLSSVGPGTVVDMERGPDAPVELLVGDRVIAEGEVVVVSGNYGVRVTKLCTPASRVRSVEA